MPEASTTLCAPASFGADFAAPDQPPSWQSWPDAAIDNVHVLASDRRGNTGHAACAVSVPANGHGPAVDSGQVFDATRIGGTVQSAGWAGRKRA